MHFWANTQSIVPPYLLQKIIDEGGKTADIAHETSAIDQIVRASRETAIASTHVTSVNGSTSTRKHSRRKIYTYRGKQLPGKLTRTEEQPATGDTAVDDVYDRLGITLDFYRQAFRRIGIDNYGSAVEATVHYTTSGGRSYTNAHWNGQYLIFGDGDGVVFQSFTRSLDVIAHEFTHGVIQYSAKLQYSHQPGAIAESICDVMGSLVKQWHLRQTVAQADWLIGAEIIGAKFQGQGLRSLSSPGTAYDDPILGKDPQPRTFAERYKGSDDNGGVHYNSSIPSRAFYLAAKAIGGYAWETFGQVWYTVLTEGLLKSNHGFLLFARTTVKKSTERFGHNSPEEIALIDAWQEVGVKL